MTTRVGLAGNRAAPTPVPCSPQFPTARVPESNGLSGCGRPEGPPKRTTCASGITRGSSVTEPRLTVRGRDTAVQAPLAGIQIGRCQPGIPHSDYVLGDSRVHPVLSAAHLLKRSTLPLTDRDLVCRREHRQLPLAGHGIDGTARPDGSAASGAVRSRTACSSTRAIVDTTAPSSRSSPLPRVGIGSTFTLDVALDSSRPCAKRGECRSWAQTDGCPVSLEPL